MMNSYLILDEKLCSLGTSAGTRVVEHHERFAGHNQSDRPPEINHRVGGSALDIGGWSIV